MNNNINNPDINYIINPSDFVILDYNKHCDNKLELSQEMLLNCGCSINVINKIFNIKYKIKKNLVYGIKKKGDVYRIEIYLYKKNINNNSDNINRQFKQNLIIILNELGIVYTNNIDSTINNLDIYLVSFDIDLLDFTFDNKLHFYIKNDKKSYTITYDIINNNIVFESYFVRLFNYDELRYVLNELKKNGLNNNWDYLIEDLKNISKKPHSIMFHYKYYNNNLGFYLFGNNYIELDNFLKKFNYKKLYSNKEKFKDLSFDLVINYDLLNNQISGTGFSDYI